MAIKTRDDVRNLTVIAHVDHGKTSLLDALLWQSGELAKGGDANSLLASLDTERSKQVAVMPRNASIAYGGTRINVLDTPHADLGGEVERTMRIVDGVILLVDACEGPPPQTRFVLRKALEAGLAPLVMINKIDMAEARPIQVAEEIRALFVDLDASREQLDYPVLYCNARHGSCRRSLDDADESMVPLFEEIIRSIPAPRYDAETPLQFLITSLDYDDFLGRLALGRVVSGELAKGGTIAHCRLDGSTGKETIEGIYGYDGLRRVELDGARAGDIVSLMGVESPGIGETLTDAADPQPLPPIRIEESTLSVVLSVNDSPMAGLEGTRASAGELRERLWQELLTNSAIGLCETESPEAFRLSGRSELQLAILIEMLRREGFEMQVGRPEVRTRVHEGEVQEPIELLVVDCPEDYVGVLTEKVGNRRGRMTKMVNHGAGRVRMEFRIPSRALIGFRAEFLNDTRGAGILHHGFECWEAWQGEIGRRTRGSLVADRPGQATAYSIGHLQHRGTIFIAPGEEVYEGMVVGENSGRDDLQVDITKERRSAELPDVPPAPQPQLIPPRSISLERALEFLHDNEVVEVTPRALRIRKRTRR